MISWDHEGIVSLFRNNRRLAAELLKELLGQELPEFSEVEIEDGDTTQRNPAELRADLVLSLRQRSESVLASFPARRATAASMRRIAVP